MKKQILLVVVCMTGAAFYSVQSQPGGSISSQAMEQMMQKTQEKRAESLRKTLKKFGFKDKGLQDAIIIFSTEREKYLMPLRMSSTQLAMSLRDERIDDTKIAAALAQFREIVNAEKTRLGTPETQEQLAAALKTLDEKTSYSKNPRLEALLTMMGLLGDEAAFVAGPAPGFGESDGGAPSGPPGVMGGPGGSGGPGGGGFPRGFPGGSFPGGGRGR